MTIEDAIQGNISQADRKRIGKGYLRVFNVMKDGEWHTPDEIAQESDTRIDTALRCCRLMKKRGHGYEKSHLGNGLYSYKITPSFQE